MTRVNSLDVTTLDWGRQFLLAVALVGTLAGRAVGEDKDAAAARATMQNQIKELGIALLNYHDTYKRYPLPAIASENGKPMLSWRVALLPFLEGTQELYQQFHLDEPWDSAHNKPLVAKMPEMFRCPTSPKAADGMTVYQVPRGPATVFPGKKPIRMRDILDGTSHTIALVEVDEDHAVPWTKPDDWELDPKQPTKGLGGHAGEVFMVGFCDGRVRPIRKAIDPDLLRKLFTRAGKEVVTEEY